MERETTEAIAKIFEGFTGHIQADAKGTYDILFRAGPPPSPDEPPREAAREVGCWSHMRRYFWEATAISKSEIAREGLARIGRVFELESLWAHHDPVKRKRLREAHLRAHVESFFEWNNHQAALIEEPGYVRRALQYTQRHEAAFKRFLDNGRLVLDNNRPERALRKIAVGRKNWLSPAATYTPALSGPCCRSTPPRGCTASIRRLTSATSSASCLSGRAVGTWSSAPATGRLPAPSSTRSSSPPKLDGSTAPTSRADRCEPGGTPLSTLRVLAPLLHAPNTTYARRPPLAVLRVWPPPTPKLPTNATRAVVESSTQFSLVEQTSRMIPAVYAERRQQERSLSRWNPTPARRRCGG